MKYELKEKDYIELFKLIKSMDLAESGGQAKMFIDDGQIFVNGNIEQRKRAKVRKGDIVRVFDNDIEIV